MKTTHFSATALAALLTITTTATAAIVGVAGGDGAPAINLGPFAITSFLPDVRPEFGLVTTVPSPLGGNLGDGIRAIAEQLPERGR